MPTSSDQVVLDIAEATKSRDGYRVSKDPLNWILQRGKVIKDRKRANAGNVGQVRWTNIGYYGTVTAMIVAYYHHRAMASKAPLPDSMLEAYRDTERLFRKIKRGLSVEITPDTIQM